ncbi:MAG: sensor histidine kinase, partial [Desulfatiglandales bacterium]
VERISQIVVSIKNFAHPGVQEKVQFDLNGAIESVVNVSRNAWKYVADLELRLDPNLPPVYGYPGELNQVILNLILNAVHAIEEAKEEGSEKGLIKIETKREKDSALISVSDTGTGIPEGIRDKIFDPFFTTKAPGKGTGQGLAIAHRYIVELHKGQIFFTTKMGKGQIFFTTKMGKGTTFYVRIPIN